ncbi:PREDICTED: ras-specific guanine nucleotide-releasing factor RalGPS2 [Propithecus coquereli]|uniref:ras-specific guanine nucleotide-releasing factor RalGPS2 n=1 Tax=Propithecus coquereli TaxID=379532 RepID=UPI00063F73AB|nr:PREDICTED: ras-specific guanine nucleotide-releasing factor RalGPS2 [Propithecus coquereli]
MDLTNGQASSVIAAATASEKSSSSESLSDKGSELKKSFDAVVFDVLKVTPEEYAGQITLMDVPVFKAIQPDELSSCGWNKKEKYSSAPNAVAFTRRFNHVSFWVVREILHAQTLKIRAEVLSHYIKTAKKLYELNNLHALMAVVSGLQSAPIFRLTKTWAELYLIHDVSVHIHHQLQHVYLPLLPGEHILQILQVHPGDHIFDGIYLSDLTYIDSAYPSTGSILENEQRSNLMNNILRIISDLQQSCEYAIPLPHLDYFIKMFLFCEKMHDFNIILSNVDHFMCFVFLKFRLSLKIEPGTSTPRSAASREDLVGPEVGASPQSGRKSVAAEGALLPQTPPSPRNLIPHGHRKCHSLGYNFIHKMNTAEFKSATFPNAGPRHLLDDSVMEPHAPSRGQAESSTLSSGISIGEKYLMTTVDKSPYVFFSSFYCYSSAESEDLAVHLYPGAVTIQGVLRRKTLLKEGKKPTVASWTKYWVALCGTQLFYYAAKSLKATERKHFKSTSNKNVSVVGWMVMMADDPEHPDLFLLTDSEKDRVSKGSIGGSARAASGRAEEPSWQPGRSRSWASGLGSSPALAGGGSRGLLWLLRSDRSNCSQQHGSAWRTLPQSVCDPLSSPLATARRCEATGAKLFCIWIPRWGHSPPVHPGPTTPCRPPTGISSPAWERSGPRGRQGKDGKNPGPQCRLALPNSRNPGRAVALGLRRGRGPEDETPAPSPGAPAVSLPPRAGPARSCLRPESPGAALAHRGRPVPHFGKPAPGPAVLSPGRGWPGLPAPRGRCPAAGPGGDRSRCSRARPASADSAPRALQRRRVLVLQLTKSSSLNCCPWLPCDILIIRVLVSKSVQKEVLLLFSLASPYLVTSSKNQRVLNSRVLGKRRRPPPRPSQPTRAPERQCLALPSSGARPARVPWGHREEATHFLSGGDCLPITLFLCLEPKLTLHKGVSSWSPVRPLPCVSSPGPYRHHSKFPARKVLHAQKQHRGLERSGEAVGREIHGGRDLGPQEKRWRRTARAAHRGGKAGVSLIAQDFDWQDEELQSGSWETWPEVVLLQGSEAGEQGQERRCLSGPRPLAERLLCPFPVNGRRRQTAKGGPSESAVRPGPGSPSDALDAGDSNERARAVRSDGGHGFSVPCFTAPLRIDFLPASCVGAKLSRSPGRDLVPVDPPVPAASWQLQSLARAVLWRLAPSRGQEPPPHRCARGRSASVRGRRQTPAPRAPPKARSPRILPFPSRRCHDCR